jgi:hypothetical protein
MWFCVNKNLGLIGPEDEGITVLWNIRRHSPNHMVSHSRRTECPAALLWELQMLQPVINCFLYNIWTKALHFEGPVTCKFLTPSLWFFVSGSIKKMHELYVKLWFRPGLCSSVSCSFLLLLGPQSWYANSKLHTHRMEIKILKQYQFSDFSQTLAVVYQTTCCCILDDCYQQILLSSYLVVTFASVWHWQGEKTFLVLYFW